MRKYKVRKRIYFDEVECIGNLVTQEVVPDDDGFMYDKITGERYEKSKIDVLYFDTMEDALKSVISKRKEYSTERAKHEKDVSLLIRVLHDDTTV